MKKIVVLLIMMLPSLSYANSLVKGEVYRTRVNIEVGDSISTPTGLKVGANSKFVVLENKSETVYAIKFNTIYEYAKPITTNPTTRNYKTWNVSDIVEDRIYYISKNIGDQNKIALDDVVSKSFGGIVSGPLIVPFKYRLDDKSISGEAMIGYYAGAGFDIGSAEYNVAVTPFLSVGLSQVSVNVVHNDENVETENKSGFTWAAGLLIQNWDKVNIGIVYGQDRIGDNSWAHEGEGWFSISVGWKL
jgi:opacity protein-like surface antigen